MGNPASEKLIQAVRSAKSSAADAEREYDRGADRIQRMASRSIDLFGGSAVSRLLALGKDPAALTEEELRGVGSFAATAASLSTQAQGGIPSIPDISLVNQYLSGQTL